MPRRRADKVDENQAQIVKDLRKLGYSVITGMDDLLIGCHGKNYWFEVKRPECFSKKTGKILASALKPSQLELLASYKGQYSIVSTVGEILLAMKQPKEN